MKSCLLFLIITRTLLFRNYIIRESFRACGSICPSTAKGQQLGCAHREQMGVEPSLRPASFRWLDEQPLCRQQDALNGLAGKRISGAAQIGGYIFIVDVL